MSPQPEKRRQAAPIWVVSSIQDAAGPRSASLPRYMRLAALAIPRMRLFCHSQSIRIPPFIPFAAIPDLQKRHLSAFLLHLQNDRLILGCISDLNICVKQDFTQSLSISMEFYDTLH